MSQGFPRNRYEMQRAGYTLVYSRPCSKCQAAIDHWRTRNGKEITMDAADLHVDVQPHFVTCKAGKRQRGKDQCDKPPVAEFARSNQAQAVVLIDRAGAHHFSIDLLSDPVDLHNTLTAAADAIRTFLVNRIAEQEQA